MKIADNFEVTRVYVDKPVVRTLSCVVDESIPTEHVGFSVRHGWKMSLNIETNFSALDSQKTAAFLNAQKLILQTIHQDSLRHIAAIRQAIYSGDDKIAMQLLDNLQSTFGL